jgi:hypothetical protein
MTYLRRRASECEPDGNRYTLTTQDKLSVFLLAVPLEQQTAEKLPRRLLGVLY